MFWKYFADALGYVVTVMCIVAPFFKKRLSMLIGIAAMNAMMSVNFLILNDFTIGSAIILNCVATAQAISGYVHDVRGKKPSRAEWALFLILYVGGGFVGLLNAVGYDIFANVWLTLLELLPIVGAIFLMLVVYAKDAQTMRKLTLCNAAIWCVYTAIIFSTTFFAEFFVLISTSAALYKYRKKPNSEHSDDLPDT